MIDIPNHSATHINQDSMSVVNNTSTPESVLKKKNNAVCYHTVHKFVPMDNSLTAHIDGDNPVDLLKVIYAGKRRNLENNTLH